MRVAIKLMPVMTLIVIAFSCTKKNVNDDKATSNSSNSDVLNEVLESRILNFISDIPVYHEMVIRETYVPVLLELRNANKNYDTIDVSYFLDYLPNKKFDESTYNHLKKENATEDIFEHYRLADRLYKVYTQLSEKYHSQSLYGESALFFELEFSELLISTLSKPKDFRYNVVEAISIGDNTLKLNDSVRIKLRTSAYNFHYPGGYCIGPLDSLNDTNFVSKHWNEFSSFHIKGENYGNFTIHGVYGTHSNSDDHRPFTFSYTVE